MSDKKTTEKTDGEAAPKKSKAGLFAGAGLAVACALGAVVATMAVPEPPAPEPVLQGPFVSKLSNKDITVNLAGEGSRRYLVMSLNAEYFAYDQSYVDARLGGSGAEDPLYTAMLKDALLKLAATRTRDQVTDLALMDAFLEDVRVAVDPILFPVCVGDSHGQSILDSASGLKVGESVMRSSLTGFLHQHSVAVDAVKKTLQLDKGAVVSFQGRERDLRLENHEGKTVFVDVTGLKPEFVGELPIGVPGQVRRIYREQFLVQ